MHDMKFCRTENVDQHVWKCLYHNVIELVKKRQASAAKDDGSDDEMQRLYRERTVAHIDDGIVRFEQSLRALEVTYKFQLDDYLDNNAGASVKGLKFVSLALVSAQKIFLILGDLSRYREQLNATKNFGRAKQWYVKAQQIIPSNGMPYNQLAIISFYTKRKFDAVYFHMRSLMSSNPIHSAKESLKVLFDEARKKYENSQKKREELLSTTTTTGASVKSRNRGGALRRETWIHPDGGRRVHRTEPLPAPISSGEEELHQIDSIELNKRFITSYLHVHGKLITKIG